MVCCHFTHWCASHLPRQLMNGCTDDNLYLEHEQLFYVNLYWVYYFIICTCILLQPFVDSMALVCLLALSFCMYAFFCGRREPPTRRGSGVRPWPFQIIILCSLYTFNLILQAGWHRDLTSYPLPLLSAALCWCASHLTMLAYQSVDAYLLRT